MNKKVFINIIKSFFLMGMIGTLTEMLMVFVSTAAVDLVTRNTIANLATCTHTSILAILVYGWSAIPYFFLHTPLTNILNKTFEKDGKVLDETFSLIFKGIIYGIIFTLIEYVCGLVSLYIFHNQAWDYRSLPIHSPDGLISLPTGLFWGVLGIAGEYIYTKVLIVEEVIP